MPVEVEIRLRALASATNKTQTEVILEGTMRRLDELEARYEDLTGRPVPPLDVVHLD